MPRKKRDHTFLSVEVPDETLAAFSAKAKEAGESASARACRLIATDAGKEHTPPERGPKPGKVYNSKPGPKPGSAKKPRGPRKPKP